MASDCKSSFVGLRNQGATCYLNSLIQSLFLTPEFRQQLFSLTESEVGLQANGKSKRKKIIVELQKLFARLQSPDFSGEYCANFALSTKSLTKSFGWNAEQAQDQHDINELYNLLLDGIEQQMPKHAKFLHRYYEGQTVNVIECLQCRAQSQRREKFVQLNIILEDQFNRVSFDSLPQSLHAAYLENMEKLENENAYFCTRCNAKTNAQKFCRIAALPSIIVCNLNRFRFDLESGERVKINKKFSFPKTLDLSMFVEHEFTSMDAGDLTEYDLIAVVVHRGKGAKAGHYHAYIRDMNNEVVWKPVKRTRPAGGNRNRRRTGNNNYSSNSNHNSKDERVRDAKEKAMAILVSILSDDSPMDLTRLGDRFKRLNQHYSWNDTYKDRLGAFSDFMRNNHRFTVLNEEKRVFSVCLAAEYDQPHNGDHCLDMASDGGGVDVVVDDDGEQEDDDLEVLNGNTSKTPNKNGGKKNASKSSKKKKKTTKKRQLKGQQTLDGFIVSDGHVDDADETDEYVPPNEDTKLANDGVSSPASARKRRQHRGGGGSPAKPEDTVSPSPSPTKTGKEEKTESEAEAETVTAGEEQKTDADADAAHWFDFNDEEIKAVFDCEIDFLYDGGDAQCPYTVIYRRKCMDSVQWPPDIPSYVEQLLLDEPLDAEEDKQTLDINISQLTVEHKLVRPDPFMCDNMVDNGARAPQDEEPKTQSKQEMEADDDIEMRDRDSKNGIEVISLLGDTEDDDDDDDQEMICSPDTQDQAAHEHKNGCAVNLRRTILSTTCATATQQEPPCTRLSKKRKYSDLCPGQFAENHNCNIAHSNAQQQPTKDEPHNKKRKMSHSSESTNSARSNKQKSKSKSKSPSKSPSVAAPAPVLTECVKCECLEPLQVTKGTTVDALYLQISEWSHIDLPRLQIARILCTGRKKTPTIINLDGVDDKSLKLKHVPVENKDEILVWDANAGDLGTKELARRQHCIKLRIYIDIVDEQNPHSNAYPRVLYINSSETLRDLYAAIHARLSVPQHAKLCENGRFRNNDTRHIYRGDEQTLRTLRISEKSVLRFEADHAPHANEIVVRYRLKTEHIKPKQSSEEEAYIGHDEEIAVLQAMMSSSFEIDLRKKQFDVRKARSDWSLGAKLDAHMKCVKQCNFSDMQKLILLERIDPSKRLISVYCQLEASSSSRTAEKRFKIPTQFLLQPNSSPNANANQANEQHSNHMSVESESLPPQIMEDADGEDEKKEVVIPVDDGLDVYDANSDVLCSLYVRKDCTGREIKRAILDCNDLNLNAQLARNIEPAYIRLAMTKKNNKLQKWAILTSTTKLASKTGRCIIEFLREPQYNEEFGNGSIGKCLLFVHKMVMDADGFADRTHAIYGSRYEVGVGQAARRKLPNLKTTILTACEWEKDLKPADMVLAVRSIGSHKWRLVTAKEVVKNTPKNGKNRKKTKNKKSAAVKEKEKLIEQKFADRDIIGVLDVSKWTQEQRQSVSAEMFETEWDKHCYAKYVEEMETNKKNRTNNSEDDESDEDEPELIINFKNDSQDEEENDEEEDGNGNNDDEENDAEEIDID